MEVRSMSSLSSILRPSLSHSTQPWKKNQVSLCNSGGFAKDKRSRRGGFMVVQAKGKKGMYRQQGGRQAQGPAIPKVEDDGNPSFVIFIRKANMNFWYPLSFISGGSTAKLVVAAKDNFLGKYLYKDVIARNLGSVIYKDEKEIQKNVVQKYRELKGCTDFRYGYKLVEKGNVRAALTTSNVVEIPRKEELKTVLDKVKDFFGEATSGAKESFGKLTAIGSIENEAEP
ncbi:hypothetical protein LUZ60_004496 [Juncus effusus]|nr:hypothetical protein LUZ60_004496 [Juncus effusus]